MHQINHLNFGQKNWVEIIDDSRGTYNISTYIKFKATMLMSNLCYYSDAYILVNETITNIGDEDQYQKCQ